MYADPRPWLAAISISAVDLQLMAMHATGRQQSENVQRASACGHCTYCCGQCGVTVEAAIGDRTSPGQVLVDDAPGAQVHVADLGIAHLAGRQTDRQPIGADQRQRPLQADASPVRTARLRNRVVRRSRRHVPAVENQ